MLEFGAEQAVLSSLDSSFIAKNVKMTSTVEPHQYAKRKGFQTMVPEAEIKELRIEGLSYLNIALKQFAEARKISLDSTELRLYKDHRFNLIGQKERVLPNTFLNTIEKKIQIDSIQVSNLNVNIEERTLQGKPARMRFEQINALITNITNDDEHIAEFPKMFFDAEGLIGGKARCRLDGFFELNHPNDAFQVRGTIDQMPLTVMNDFVDPISEVNFKSGQLEELEFKILADKYYARGKVKMNIDDVSIQIGAKKPSGSDRERIMRKIAISAGNVALQVHQKLTDPTKRKGNISYERDPNKSVFSYVFRSTLSGMLSAMGIKNKEDRLQR
jgi:hypothetical protein